MNKTFTITIATLLILIVTLFGLLYIKLRQKPEVVLPATELRMSTNALDVSITYPNIPGVGPSVDQANASIRSDIENRVLRFEQEAKENAALGIDLPAAVKSTVTGSPAVEEKNDRYIAIFMGMEWYLRGSAHPSHTIDTYVYDYQETKLVAQSDFFKGDYLPLLSKLSREDLKNQSTSGDLGFTVDEAMLEEGTEPTASNFKHILPLTDGLAIYFDEYQVAPYAAGPQQVVIPYNKLVEVIKPEGVLGVYIQ